MSTRIKGTDSQAIGASRSQPVERVKRTTVVTSGQQGDAAATDSVQITTAARQLSSLAQVISETPDINSAKVEALQQSIGQGQYQIDSGRIADRLLQLESDVSAAGVKG